MPTYSYRCQDCAAEFDRRQTDYADHAPACPDCGGTASRVPSPFTFKFALPSHWRRGGNVTHGHSETMTERDAYGYPEGE